MEAVNQSIVEVKALETRKRKINQTSSCIQKSSITFEGIMTRSRFRLNEALESEEKGSKSEHKKVRECHVCEQPPSQGVNRNVSNKFRCATKHKSDITHGVVCQICGVITMTRTALKSHKDAHQRNVMACNYCPLVFLTIHGKILHQDLHCGGQKASVDDQCNCGLCGGLFISIVYLEFHLLELHGPDALHNEKNLISYQNPPLKHAFTKDKLQMYRCGVCCMTFSYISNLYCHMANHTRVSYACGMCVCEYLSLDMLVSHIKQHLDSTEEAQNVPDHCSVTSTQSSIQGNFTVQHPISYPTLFMPFNILRTQPEEYLIFTAIPSSHTASYYATSSSSTTLLFMSINNPQLLIDIQHTITPTIALTSSDTSSNNSNVPSILPQILLPTTLYLKPY